MRKILVILGPTATGKTDLGLILAKKFNGELVACDSRQVYLGLDIGTGKMPGEKLKVKKGRGFWEVSGIKIWMYDVSGPNLQYSVADYVKDAAGVIEDITSRGKLPIIVVGTGLYLKALLNGVNSSSPKNLTLRKKLEKSGVEELQKKLNSLSPTKFNNLNNSDKNNKRRLIRYIEIALNPPNKKFLNSNFQILNSDILRIGLVLPRPLLNQRIDQRVDLRINQGMIKEAEELFQKGLSLKRMTQLGLEYGLLAKLLERKINKEEFTKLIKIKIHQYAKRQMTWFKKEPDINWFDISKKDYLKKVANLASDWYNR